MFKTGIKKTNQKIKESHFMIGLLKIKKLSKSFFFLLVQFKELKIMLINFWKVSENLIGYGSKK
jgi:hypothetical protein